MSPFRGCILWTCCGIEDIDCRLIAPLVCPISEALLQTMLPGEERWRPTDLHLADHRLSTFSLITSGPWLEATCHYQENLWDIKKYVKHLSWRLWGTQSIGPSCFGPWLCSSSPQSVWSSTMKLMNSNLWSITFNNTWTRHHSNLADLIPRHLCLVCDSNIVHPADTGRDILECFTLGMFIVNGPREASGVRIWCDSNMWRNGSK